jgi:hypothetical protein
VARRSYVTANRVRRTSQRLSERDWLIVHDVARLRVASGAQLRRMHYGAGESAQRLARRELAGLVEDRVLARLARRIGGVRSGSDGYVYSLDAVGQRLVDPGRRRYREPWTPSDSHLAHALSVSELFMQLRIQDGDWQLEDFTTEPRCWRSFSGPGGRPCLLKPDAFAVGATGEYEDRWFIEVDRATEALTRITDKSKLYISYWQSGREQSTAGIFPRVVWIAPDELRREQLVDTLGNLPADSWQLFQVTTTTDAAALITARTDSTTPGEEVN